MSDVIELMQDGKRIFVFYPITGKTEVIDIDDSILPFTFRCRAVSKEDFDMGVTIFETGEE